MQRYLVSLVTGAILTLFFASIWLGNAVDSSPQVQASNLVFERVGSIGGTISDIAVAGSYAYISEGMNLSVLDVSDVSKPTRVAQLPLPDVVEQLVVSGSFVYIANGYEGMQIVNVSNPANPTLAGSYTESSMTIDDIHVLGSNAYVIGQKYDRKAKKTVYFFTIINVSTPVSPTLTQQVSLTTSPTALFVTETMAYVTYEGHTTDGGLQLIDVSDKDHPTLRGTLPLTDNTPKDVVVVGKTAYVDDNSIHIIDVNNPDSPTLQGSAELACSSGWHIALANTLVYAADGAYGLRVVDVSNPQKPIATTAYQDNWIGFTNNVEVVGSLAYATSEGRLQILDVSDLTNITLKGFYHAEVGYASEVLVDGSNAYVANSAGLHLIDVSTPAKPTRKSAAIIPRNVAGGGVFTPNIWHALVQPNGFCS